MDREPVDQYTTLFSKREPEAPEEPEERGGSYIPGLLGAFLGAAAGAVPWFLVSTFTSFFVGWLGFLVGWAACWGYRKFRGVRRTGFAMTAIVLSSIAVLVLAEFGSWMFLLCTDAEWQRDAARMRMPVWRLAFESLLMPENLPHILPGFLMGLLIGGLGIFSARRSVLAYTDPERAARMPAAPVSFRQSPPVAGMPLPYSFTVRMKPSTWKVGYVCIGFAVVFLALFSWIGFSFGEWDILPVGGGLSLLIAAEGILILCLNRKCRLEINGDRLRYVSRLGKVREFTVSDIAGVSVSNVLARTLYGHDGEVLAKINQNMENIPLLNQYLTERGVPLRG